MVVLDAIGIFHDDVVTIRKMVAQKNPDLDHIIISATHCHEVPDLMGLCGERFYRSGVDPEYMQYVQEQTVKAILQARENQRPAYIKLAKIDSIGDDLVRDSRPPKVLDEKIHLMQLCDAQTDSIFGLLMNWGNHPETLASDNLWITADFAHYWIDGLEKGIIYDNMLKRAGIGGTVVFANGAIGGLMTSLRSQIYDPWLDKSFKRASFEKARAQGYRLAKLVLDKIEQADWDRPENPAIKLYAQTFNFKVQNNIFKLAGALGIFNRGFIGFSSMRSEVNLVTLGDAWILTIPGEINPEIVNGGIESPDGGDFPIEPVEVPPLRELMRGKYNFVIGLANDEVGYIMPKTQWDQAKPYTYGSKKGFYGEINSLGPDAGPTLYQEVKTLLNQMNNQ